MLSRSTALLSLLVVTSTSCRPAVVDPLEARVEREAPPALPALGAPGRAELAYSARATTPFSLGGARGHAVFSGVLDAGRARGLELSGDGRLARLAEWFATVTQHVGGSPPLEAIDFATRHLGMMEPLPALLVTVKREHGWEPPLESLFEHAPRNIRYNRVGVAVFQIGSTSVAGVALASSHLKTSLVPRSVPPGSRTDFEGELSPEYKLPELAVTSPNGSTRRVPLGQERSFRTQLDFAATGRSQIELLATGPSGLEVVANFPVYVGIEPPADVSLERRPSENAEAAVEKLRELLNAERRQVGLRPLEFDPRLSEVALAHSLDMADQRFFGHESPTRGDPLRRAKESGLSLRHLGENVGRAPSAQDLHHLLMGSPGHRGNILKPEFTHVGIGVVADDTAGERVLLATQLFGAMQRRLPPRQFNAELLSIVNESRHRHSAPPLELDEELERLACAGEGERGEGKAIVSGALDPEDAAREPSLHAPAARRVGFCVVGAEPAGLASRSMVIVVSASSYPEAALKGSPGTALRAVAKQPGSVSKP